MFNMALKVHIRCNHTFTLINTLIDFDPVASFLPIDTLGELTESFFSPFIFGALTKLLMGHLEL